MRFILVVLALLALSSVIAADIRYCAGEPQRYADGTIKRSAKVLREFKLRHPCPVTGLSTGACEGWAIDHVIPRASGGCDEVFNMQWLPVQIKSCAGQFCKDRWERRVYLPHTLP